MTAVELSASPAWVNTSRAELAAAYEAAAETSAAQRWIKVGDWTLRLRFGSDRMLFLMDAFAHLVCEEQPDPDLTVWVWDSPGQQGPPVPGSDPDAPRGTRVVWEGDGLHGCYQPGQSTLTVLDEAGAVGWFWCESAAELPYWEHAAPLRLLLSWWLAARGANLVHGAAVGRPGSGCLIVGRGGSGKSTTSLLSLLAGLGFASDDYVVVQRDRQGRGPYVHSAFGSGKLDNAQCLRFPELADAVVNPQRLPDEKAVFLVNRYAPDRMAASMPLRAVLVPRITGLPDTDVVPTSPMAALAALAPSTIFQLPGAPEAELSAMAALVRSVPVFALRLGTDLPQIPRAIDDLLRAQEMPR